MTPSNVRFGIITPSAEERETLRRQVAQLGMAEIGIEEDQYCRVQGDRPTRRFIETRPDLVIIDMQDVNAALQTLRVLHTALPETWFLVCSESSDSELIIETMQAGAREYLPKPIPPLRLSQALERYLATKRQHQQQTKAGKIYCITAAKGGTGATTLSINIASAIAQAPSTRVALLDFNTPVGDAAAYLNLSPQFTLSDALRETSRLDSMLLESYMADANGFEVLASPKEFLPEPAPDVGEIATPSAIAKILEVATRTYTHTVIDIGSYLDQHWLQVVMERVSGFVVVLTPELPALWRTKRLLTSLAAHGDTGKVRLVLNRTRRADEITDDEIEKALNHPVFWKLPNNYFASIEAINAGTPLVSRNRSTLASCYRDLAYQLGGISSPKKQQGLLKLLSRNGRNSDG